MTDLSHQFRGQCERHCERPADVLHGLYVKRQVGGPLCADVEARRRSGRVRVRQLVIDERQTAGERLAAQRHPGGCRQIDDRGWMSGGAVRMGVGWASQKEDLQGGRLDISN